MNPLKWFGNLFSRGMESGKAIVETPSLRQVRRHLKETTPMVHKAVGGAWVVLEVEEVPELSRKINEDPMNEDQAAGFVLGWNHCKQYTMGLKRSVVRAQSKEVKAVARRRQAETKSRRTKANVDLAPSRLAPAAGI